MAIIPYFNPANSILTTRGTLNYNSATIEGSHLYVETDFVYNGIFTQPFTKRSYQDVPTIALSTVHFLLTFHDIKLDYYTKPNTTNNSAIAYDRNGVFTVPMTDFDKTVENHNQIQDNIYEQRVKLRIGFGITRDSSNIYKIYLGNTNRVLVDASSYSEMENKLKELFHYGYEVYFYWDLIKNANYY